MSPSNKTFAALANNIVVSAKAGIALLGRFQFASSMPEIRISPSEHVFQTFAFF